MQSGDNKSHIERHTIYQIPLDERHGQARQLFTLWFGANLNVLTVVTGALATTIFHQSFLSGVTAILVGNLIGTVFMALHAAQGPEARCAADGSEPRTVRREGEPASWSHSWRSCTWAMPARLS